ncbi:hypothetical protein AKO1_015324 [Acrasis kona]|uniref:Uncharacterized protein n=1 Tax=Acrasis kona TaxID=1008807 RepID=A0AAW2YXQ4_9EUKA
MFGSSKAKSPRAATVNETGGTLIPTVLLNRFPDIKAHHIDVHPVKSWILFADRKGAVYLYDWEQHDVLWSFSLNGCYENKKEEISLYKVLEKNYNNISLPDWYDETLLRGDKIGDIESVQWYDEDVVHWKLHDKLENTEVGMFDKEFELNRRLSLAPSPRPSPNGLSIKSKRFISAKTPKCIVLQTESRIILLRYDEASSGLFFFDEVKSSSLENKSITSFAFLYSHPIIAIGCSDGVVRLWNYKTKSVVKVITIGTKPVTKMLTISRADPYNSFPSLLAVCADGTLHVQILDKNVPEFTVKNATPISDVIVTNGEIVTLVGNTIITRSLNGSVNKQIALPKLKTLSFEKLSATTSCNSTPNNYILVPNAKTNKITYTSLSSDLLGETQVYAFDIAPTLIYVMQQHPLQPDLLFLGTENGLVALRMNSGRYPASAVSTNKNQQVPQSPPPISVDLSSFTSLPSKLERVTYYTRGCDIMRRTITTRQGKDVYNDATRPITLQKSGHVKLSTSPSGMYLVVHWVDDLEYDIYRTDTWTRVHNNVATNHIEWCSHGEDKFATLKNSILSIYMIKSDEISVICDNLQTPQNIVRIHGGLLLGITLQDGSFVFAQWNSEFNQIGDSLPTPTNVKWNASNGLCLLQFPDAFAIFKSQPQFVMICYVRIKIDTAMWWQGTLFVTTNNHIMCFFPLDKNASVTLASFDVASYSNVSQGNEEDSLDPIPQARPKGVLNFLDVVGEDMMVLDALSNIHKISLSHPAIKFRMLVAAGHIQRALDWLHHISYELHDDLSEFLVSYGYIREACGVGSLEASRRFQMCLESGMIKEGLECLQSWMEQNSSSSEQAYQAYLLLGNAAEMKSADPDLIRGIYWSAASIDPRGYAPLMSFLSKSGKGDLTSVAESLDKLAPSAATDSLWVLAFVLSILRILV